MAITQINPYLFFDGTALQAIRLYESALGAKVERISRYGDMPANEEACGPMDKDRVMHASLALGPDVLMISDGPPGTPPVKETNVQVSLQFDDVDEMRKRFDALAVGGKVTMPLQDTFWNATFGMLTDAYNISWMFNCEKKKG